MAELDEKTMETEETQEKAENTETAEAKETEETETAKTEKKDATSDFVDKINNTKDTTDEFEAEDIENNKAMGILAYLSWLVLIPLFAAKDSKYARYHANQGIILAIAEFFAWVVCGLLGMIPYIGWLFSIINGLISLVCLCYTVLGIVNVANGKAKELPFIGGIRILK